MLELETGRVLRLPVGPAYLRRVVGQLIALIDIQDPVRRIALHRKQARDSRDLPSLVRLDADVLELRLRGDGPVDLLPKSHASFPPPGLEPGCRPVSMDRGENSGRSSKMNSGCAARTDRGRARCPRGRTITLDPGAGRKVPAAGHHGCLLPRARSEPSINAKRTHR